MKLEKIVRSFFQHTVVIEECVISISTIGIVVFSCSSNITEVRGVLKRNYGINEDLITHVLVDKSEYDWSNHLRTEIFKILKTAETKFTKEQVLELSEKMGCLQEDEEVIEEEDSTGMVDVIEYYKRTQGFAAVILLVGFLALYFCSVWWVPLIPFVVSVMLSHRVLKVRETALAQIVFTLSVLGCLVTIVNPFIEIEGLLNLISNWRK